ncbi:MAG: EAL domain-containing protein [Lysobacteraceae bacterium]
MFAQDESQQRAELRLAFLRHLPARAETIARRARAFCQDGWDINGLSVLHEDVQRLAGASGRHGMVETSEQLLALEVLLGDCLDREALPDAPASNRIVSLVDGLTPSLPQGANDPVQPAAVPVASSQFDDSTPRFAAAPPHYWRRWVADAEPPKPLAIPPALLPAKEETPVEEAPAAAPPSTPVPAAQPTPTPAKPAVATTPSPVAATAPAEQHHHRVYHLSDANEVSLALDQRLETLGYELELLESDEELREVLAALPPDIVLVDASFSHRLEAIGEVLQTARKRTGNRIPLLAQIAQDSVPLRLAARRAGVDALLLSPPDAATVLSRMQELLDPDREEAYRILIVEDDRSQGLFAESILRNAGMEPRVVDDAFQVLDTMQEFRPDMVLMDLYMPQCDGTELTALIREREEFLHTPIVFLSGESDQDKHFAALDAGGDDFLSKPIRPRYLIASVNNRVKRARALKQRGLTEAVPTQDSETGLYARSHLLDQINVALGDEHARQATGGVLFIEVDGIAALRERLGLSAVETLLQQSSQLLAASLNDKQPMARFGDGSFILLDQKLSDDALDALAADLRRRLSSHAFRQAGHAIRLRASIGIAALRHGFADATALLNVAERATREARALEGGVFRHRPEVSAVNEADQTMLGLIRDAIERDAFELLYQPIVAVQGGDLAQYQTLIRLRDDGGRLHTAAEFVPLAEQSDLIVDLDRWVLTQALRTIDQRRDDRPVRLFVNQSGLSLASSEHAEWLAAQIEARKVPNGSLILEMSLEDLLLDVEDVEPFCRQLVPHGVQFCISQYRAGAEGDRMLEKLPADYLKLSPAYLRAAQTQRLRDELREIIDTAHGRAIEVIAPRVEDAQAAATLWISGIDYIQGNLVQQAARRLDFDFKTAVL